MNLDKETKTNLVNAVNLLNNINIDNLKFECYKISTGELIFKNSSGRDIIINVNSIMPEKSEKSEKKIENLSETSDAPIESNINDSLTSDLNSVQNLKIQNGGKHIFKTQKYSDTSSEMMSNNMSNMNTDNSALSMEKMLNKYRNNNINDLSENQFEKPSFIGQEGGYNNIFNRIQKNTMSDGFSETSEINQNGGNYETFDTLRSISEINIRGGGYNNIFNRKQNNIVSDDFSETSEINQNGGNFETTDTLRSISDIKERKKSNKSSVDLNIFKRNAQNSQNSQNSQNAQNGGNLSNQNSLKQKMNEIGINSSSTSSICE